MREPNTRRADHAAASAVAITVPVNRAWVTAGRGSNEGAEDTITATVRATEVPIRGIRTPVSAGAVG